MKVRRDYLPFGEKISAAIGGRISVPNYAVLNTTRQQFTSKERDNETGLDYFGARYHSSTQGRFTSPDEFSGGPDELYDFAEDASDNPTFYADLTNPQSLNKYQYTYNNPINLTDDDGHCPCLVPIGIAAGAVYLILSSPDTTQAVTGNEKEPIARSGDGVTTMLTVAAVTAAAGPIVDKVARPILRATATRIGGKIAVKASNQSVGAEASAGVGTSGSGLGRTATTKSTGKTAQKTVTTVTDPAGSTKYKTSPGQTGGQSTTIVRRDAKGNIKYVKQEARHTTRVSTNQRSTGTTSGRRIRNCLKKKSL